VIRIEPTQFNFLELKPEGLQFKVPPLNTTIELVKITYIEPVSAYKTVHYKTKCNIVASGEWMYHNSAGGTETKTYYIVLTINGYYYLLEPKEQNKYLIKGRSKVKGVV